MGDGAGAGSLERARAALAAGEPDEAFDVLTAADIGGRLDPAELPLLGEVAYGAGHLDVTIEAWERTHAFRLRTGNRIGAAEAAVRVAMHLLFDTALMAPVRGWLARAEELLDDGAPPPALAWLSAVRCYERMLSGDLPAARQWAERAAGPVPPGDDAAAALGRVALARLVILDGDVAAGLALLDQAGVATVSGNLDPLSTGVVYCELVCALQGLALYDVAEQWTEAMERWSRTSAVGSLRGRCRVHRAEILRLRGACDEAERQAVVACEELQPYLRRELGWPLTELGRIRLHRGDVAGAEEALLAAHGAGWEAQPGLALVRLAQGDADDARDGIRAALERPVPVPWKERPPTTELQRAPVLEAQVEIEVAVGDPARARVAADELERIAARFGSAALTAGAVLARGRVQLAEGAPQAAVESLSEAVRRWTQVGAPYETAVARRCLADAHAAVGDGARAALERAAAGTALAALATGAEPARAPSGGTFRREGEYWSVVFERRTVRVRDRAGMRHLARLLADPGREFHVLDLVAAEAGGTGTPHGAAPRTAPGNAGALLDDRAKEAYRRRLAEIDDDLDQARAVGDPARVAQGETERDFLVRELARAFGLGGRARRTGSASERARAGVTRAIRQAIARIAAHHPELGAHLDRTIRTGTYCAYDPDPRLPTPWRS